MSGGDHASAALHPAPPVEQSAAMSGEFTRDLRAMAARHHDLLIIGGGIAGATIAWDATLRGLRVALVEKADFSSGTSAGSSKLVHGGLRYLRNMEFALVRESLRERRIWQRIAPHMIRPLPFLLPTDARHRLMLSAGLTLYDLLAFDRGRGIAGSERPRRHRFINWEKACALEPALAGTEAAGAFVYYDCQSWSPERLGLECLVGAAEGGAMAANYADAEELTAEDTDYGCRITGAIVTDRLTGEQCHIGAGVTINAAGPWADQILALATNRPSHRLMRSKGAHIVTRKLVRSHALTMELPNSMGGGHVFVLPWRGHALIGTTDTRYDGDPDALVPTDEDVARLIAMVNAVLPGVQLRREDVRFAYAGLRPLIGDEGKDTYSASRKAEVVDHERADGIEGFLSALGGKWTTARHVAERTVDLAVKRLGVRTRPCRTGRTPLPGGRTRSLAALSAVARHRHPQWPDDTLDHLARLYGSELDRVIARAEADPTLKAPLGADRPDIGAEVVHAVRAEMARTLDDVIFRRTGLGTLGHPGTDCLAAAARLMAEELDWDAEETARQIAAVEYRFSVWETA